MFKHHLHFEVSAVLVRRLIYVRSFTWSSWILSLDHLLVWSGRARPCSVSDWSTARMLRSDWLEPGAGRWARTRPPAPRGWCRSSSAACPCSGGRCRRTCNISTFRGVRDFYSMTTFHRTRPGTLFIIYIALHNFRNGTQKILIKTPYTLALMITDNIRCNVLLF